jgi:aspartyl/asparaginyl beta-hydroxylase (cupin superfamily)
MDKSPWERTVELTIAVGERILAPIERFIGKRSLVGDATFFPTERFPWIEHIEANWQTIREELQGVLADREALPNFQDISKDQIEITDDDDWKTYFLYGYGFAAKLGVETCPKTAALMREIPGMTTAMFSILSPRKHILDHRGPYKGVLRYHLGLIVPREAEQCRIRVGEDIRHWQQGKSLVFDDTFNHEVWNDTDETRVVLFVDVLRPLAVGADQPADRQGDRLLAVRARCQAQPGSVGTTISCEEGCESARGGARERERPD